MGEVRRNYGRVSPGNKWGKVNEMRSIFRRGYFGILAEGWCG